MLVQLKEGIHKHRTTAFSLGMDDGTLRYQGRLCVPNVDGLRERIMAEAHTSRYSVHQGSTKMYHDLKDVYCWNVMKKGVADFVAQFSNCQQVKAEHQRPGGLAQSTEIPMWKWEMINMDFVVGFHASIQMAPFEALYGRRCRSLVGWFKVGEAELIGPDLVHQAMEKVNIIKERLKTTQNRQKSYSDVRLRDLELKEDDWVFLKVVRDSSAIVPVETIEISEELSYEEILVAILDIQVRKLRNKEIASVKCVGLKDLCSLIVLDSYHVIMLYEDVSMIFQVPSLMCAMPYMMVLIDTNDDVI
ncbi:uncharacterized protein [Nicotiana tomentosiformis]|uniref:uncharacterized protein n=1 Tax=Nicotiana tomentosiformis TaxID=4098 RepID=UPI00388CDD80